MPTNLNEFLVGVEQSVAEIDPAKGVSELQRMMAFTLLTLIVQKNPVNKIVGQGGRSRGNWQVTVASPATGEIVKQWGVDGKQPLTDTEIAEVNSVLAALPPFSTVWLSNNVPYIERLEEGWSDQTPEGMVAVSLEELRQIFPV